MRNPQFIVAGTARAGTTSLNSYLIQHPEIFLPIVKEPCLFTFAGEKIDYKNGKFAFNIERCSIKRAYYIQFALNKQIDFYLEKK